MCAVGSLAFLASPGLRGFFVAAGRRGLWCLAVFFVVVGAAESGDG
jgi:hypothetical protein